MKRIGQIFVILAAIVSLLAPVPVFCASNHQADHSCCAAQAELSTSCCQSDAAPKPAVPTTTASRDQFNGDLVFLDSPAGWMAMQQPITALAHFSANPPIHLPATILRT